MFSYVNADTTLQRLSTISHLVSDLFALYTFILNKSSDLSFTRSFTRLLATCCHSVGVLLFFRNFCSALHKELVLCSKKQYGLIKLSIYVANKLKMPVLMFWTYWKFEPAHENGSYQWLCPNAKYMYLYFYTKFLNLKKALISTHILYGKLYVELKPLKCSVQFRPK